MVVVLDWISRQFHRTDDGRKYDPLESQCPSWESGLQDGSTVAEFTAACQRIQYVKHVIIMKLGALRCKRYRSPEEQSATLQEEINQHDALLKAIINHTAALTVASTRGRHLGADVEFWREHKQLLQLLPEEMRPDWAIVDVKRDHESMTSLRKRDHVQIAIPSY